MTRNDSFKQPHGFVQLLRMIEYAEGSPFVCVYKSAVQINPVFQFAGGKFHLLEKKFYWNMGNLMDSWPAVFKKKRKSLIYLI